MIVRDEIRIEAHPARVWDVTVDVERWPEWTPTVTSVMRTSAGSFGIGSTARIKQPLQPESEWVVTEFDPGRRFAWETRRRGMHLVGRHEIAPDGAGTRNVLSVKARGYLARILWPILKPAMGRALADENRGLKARCERLPTSEEG